MKKKYRTVKMGKGNYIIQEDEFLFGFIWWSTGFVTIPFKTVILAQQKLEELKEKERVLHAYRVRKANRILREDNAKRLKREKHYAQIDKGIAVLSPDWKECKCNSPTGKEVLGMAGRSYFNKFRKFQKCDVRPEKRLFGKSGCDI